MMRASYSPISTSPNLLAAGAAEQRAAHRETPIMNTSKKPTLTVHVDDQPFPITVIGRDAWALSNLIRTGAVGCTPIDTPGPRWSHYVWKLRGVGINIETIDEDHGGPFAGTHARYVLRSKVRIAEPRGEAA